LFLVSGEKGGNPTSLKDLRVRKRRGGHRLPSWGGKVGESGSGSTQVTSEIASWGVEQKGREGKKKGSIQTGKSWRAKKKTGA